MSDDGTGSGGSEFDWGLRPGGAAEQPEASAGPPPAEPAEPPPLTEPPPLVEPPALPTPPEPGGDRAPVPAPWEPEATQLMDAVQPDPEPEPAASVAPEESAPTLPPAAAAAPGDATAPGHAEQDGSAIDALFGDTQFKEYEGGIADVTERPFAGRAAAAAAAPDGSKPTGASRTQKVLIGVVGGLVAVLALIALFFLGTRLPTLLGPAPAVAVSTPSASPSPTSTAKPVGPVANGVHPWTALLGGECLDPYTSPWAETFTVVSCSTPHPAQMVYRGTFATTTDPSYPGVEKLQAQMSLLCAAPGVIDLAAAGAYSDAQVQGSYPVNEEEWATGQHDYFCFVSRSSGQPLTTSVAVPQVAPTPAP